MRVLLDEPQISLAPAARRRVAFPSPESRPQTAEEALLRQDAPVSELPVPMPEGPLLGVLVARQAAGATPERYSVRQVPLTIGRGMGSGLVVPTPSVSEAHAELTLRDGVWLLRDLDSINGSWVDGEPVHGTLPVAPGSTIRLGEVELVLVPHDRQAVGNPTADAGAPAAPRRRPAPPLLMEPTTTSSGPSLAAWAVVGVAAVLLVAFLILRSG
jgi:pSer/pThr/pTyr-binding forkhead associated (FHA) protein